MKRNLFLSYNVRESTLSLITTKSFVSETIEIKIATKAKSYGRISSVPILNGNKKECGKGIIFLIRIENKKKVLSRFSGVISCTAICT